MKQETMAALRFTMLLCQSSNLQLTLYGKFSAGNEPTKQEILAHGLTDSMFYFLSNSVEVLCC
jgi:hypothetical protein